MAGRGDFQGPKPGRLWSGLCRFSCTAALENVVVSLIVSFAGRNRGHRTTRRSSRLGSRRGVATKLTQTPVEWVHSPIGAPEPRNRRRPVEGCKIVAHGDAEGKPWEAVSVQLQ